ncbi:hypothetical protein CYMTET_34583 [Cymbomonas tetramitiformis]|uniref:Hydroxyproline O-arabinosyltransferase-like domain-containing protein n=1 Tax=Cymbomonas tetramitiformis TaxID=36881 RepID=A0AAE0FB23_9CHLO|nr:hypothetical protein CYMTET_34583 [Cymbomonas tetramitiformis]
MHKDQLAKVVPVWHELALSMKKGRMGTGRNKLTRSGDGDGEAHADTQRRWGRRGSCWDTQRDVGTARLAGYGGAAMGRRRLMLDTLALAIAAAYVGRARVMLDTRAAMWGRRRVMLTRVRRRGDGEAHADTVMLTRVRGDVGTARVMLTRDREANAAFGWVLEMWAFSVACAQFHIRHELHKEFMLQPPWDSSFQIDGKDAYMIHYTYGNDFDLNGKFTPGKFGQWRFDKRQYMTRAPQKNLQMPPKGTNPVVVKLVEMINDASSHIYNWH